jgi:hypothetical protein
MADATAPQVVRSYLAQLEKALAELVETPGREARWYPVLAALLVAFGGIVIPVIGWIVGMAMVVMSATWRRGDKWAAVLTPVVAGAVLPLIVALIGSLSSSGLEEPNPLIPHPFDVVWSSVVFLIPVNAVVGIWLLWRAKSGMVSVRKPSG